MKKVRVDFFKPKSGKWYTDEYLEWWTGTLPALAHEQFQSTLRANLWDSEHRRWRLNNMVAVCLEDETQLEDNCNCGPGFPVMGLWKDGDIHPLGAKACIGR